MWEDGGKVCENRKIGSPTLRMCPCDYMISRRYLLLFDPLVWNGDWFGFGVSVSRYLDLSMCIEYIAEGEKQVYDMCDKICMAGV